MYEHIVYVSKKTKFQLCFNMNSSRDRHISQPVKNMAELLLDSNIRFWVFLPIVVITFLIGIIRHYVTILLSSEKKVELQQIADR